MKGLSSEQVDFIADEVENSEIDSDELKEDLIDHLCCAVEDYMIEGMSFDEAYGKAYQSVCPNGFGEIYEETLLLLSTKKIILMKKLLYLSGFVTTTFITTSYLFKALHLPGAAILLGISMILLVLVLLPLFLLHFFKKEFSQYMSYKMKYIFGFLGMALFITSIFFKLMHLQGAEAILLISVGVINFGFLPFFFYRLYKKDKITSDSGNIQITLKYILGFFGIVLFLTATIFKVLHYPFWPVLNIISVVIINFGFLPFVFYGMYRKSVS